MVYRNGELTKAGIDRGWPIRSPCRHPRSSSSSLTLWPRANACRRATEAIGFDATTLTSWSSALLKRLRRRSSRRSSAGST